MKSKHLPLILLMALFVPLAMMGQTTTALLTENFNSMSSLSTSYSGTDWFTYKANSGNNWTLNTTTDYAHGGSGKSAMYSYSSNYAADAYLVSTPFTVSANMVELSVSLYHMNRSSSYSEAFEVFFVKASDVTSAAAVASATHYSAIANTTYTNTSYAEATGSNTNSALAGQSVRVVVHCTSAADMWNLYVDDITVTETTVSGPAITLSPASATVLTGFTETLTASMHNVTGTPTITYTSSNNNVATVSGSGTTATVTAVAPGTATITATMAYEGNTYPATCEIIVEDPSYCKPSFSNTSDYIKSFTTIGGEHNISNTNTSQGTGGYSDYYNSHYVSAEPGTTISFSVVRGYDDTYQYGLWVDWNKDYVFDNSTEKMASTSSAEDWSSSFTIPANTAAGDYHMRVLQLYGSSNTLSPCVSAFYGEGEDYKLTVLSTGAYTITCATTTGGTISADKNNADENVVVTITATPDANYQLTALTYTPEGGSAQNIDITSTPYTFTMPAANVTVNATFTLPGNLPPYDLTVGTPLGHSVVLGWTGVSTNTHHQNYEVYYSTTNIAPSDNLSSGYQTTNTVPYTLVGLTPSTTYYAWVRDNCGADGKSTWVAFNAFTTDVACPAPNSLTVSNLTAHSANVSWNGESESYDILYHTATITGTTENPIFTYGFEDNLVGWTTYALGYSSDLTNWSQYDATNLGSDYNNTNHGGSYVGRSKSYAGSSGGDVTVDNWLISPQITIGDKMTFWVSDDGTWHEHLEIRVCTAASFSQSTLTSDFALVEATAATGKPWEMKTIDLSAYAGQQGYIAIRNNDTGKDFVCLDDITVYETIYTYDYGTDQFASSNTNSCPITGLSPETLYEVQVMGNCGDEGTSAWSNSFMFTTPDNCGAPQELAASNVTATTATLTWADDKDSYNLKYRKVYFYEDFESETLPTGWTTIDANSDGNTWGIGFATSHSGNNGAYNLSYIYNSTGTTPDDYLVSPLLDLQGTLRVWLSGYGDSYEEHFAIYVSTSGNSASDFTTTLVGETTTTSSYVEYTADLSSYEGQQGYIAIRHFNCSDQYYLYVDDFGLYGTEDWVTLSPNPTTETANLTDLSMTTTYEWQVQGVNCDGNGGTSDWSAVATFTTLEVPPVPVESITVDPAEIEVIVGNTFSIIFTVLPADATNPAVTFSSADETVATVNDNGDVTGVVAGTTTITIAATDGSDVTGTLNVTVTNVDVEDIYANDITIIAGATATINYTVIPNNPTDASVTFTSANTAIATVDANGVVTGKGVGETTITIASVQNPEVTTDITVTVASDPNAVQFTLNVDKTIAVPGDVITVEAYLNAPESGDYNGFTGLVLGLHFNTDAFAVYGDPVKGDVANACTMAMTALPNEAHPDLVQCSCVMPVGSPNTTTGLVFTVQFTVLTDVVFGSYTFYAEPTSASNFVYAPDTNNPGNKTPIAYEYVPSTVEVGNIYTKEISAYTEQDGEVSGWHLIASPLDGTIDPTIRTNLITDDATDFALYRFNQSCNLEWENWKSENNYHFNLESGRGYLYGNTNGGSITFIGVPYSGNGQVTLSKDDDAEFAGWNLVGNPFAQTAYIDKSYFILNPGGSEVIANVEGNSVEAMEGIFVIAEEDGDTLTFSTTNSNSGKGASLSLNVTKGRSVIDRAIVSFGESSALPKFQLNPNHTKVYIPQDNKDYAVVSAENQGTMPVNFKAEENGTYTLSFNAEEVTFSYLHLIDNMTGNDIDLLQIPSYTFNATTTDYESRFKLVFATGSNSNDDSFAFCSNGNWIISNEGQATLQVIDITGRILSSETVNGSVSKAINAAPGVYMLRLINGDNVKVQKIVVE